MKVIKNKIHHCTSSGIRADKSDNIRVQNNLVYGNTWWTYTASSAIVFAEADGTGSNWITGNKVYGNRNYLPFFMNNMPAGGGNSLSKYGAWD